MAKVALVQDVMVEYMGYMYISAVLKDAGHTVELFYCEQSSINKFISDVKKFSPDIVGFSVLSPSLNFMLELGQRIKEETDAITVYGNLHIIFNPQVINEPAVDIVCIGEGEYPLKELCKRIDEGEEYNDIKGFWVKTKGGIIKNSQREDLVNLDELPFHDRILYDKYPFFKFSRYLRVATGRGCPGRCSFCSNSALAKYYGVQKYLRRQNPYRAIQELKFQIQKRKKVNFIFFTDEVFWLKNEWLREFLDLYKKDINIPFCANFRFGPISEEEIKLLSESKAKNLIVAVETGSEYQRRNMLNKNVKDESIFQVAEWLRKYNIKYTSSVMFGLPNDTVRDHINRLTFYRKLKPTYLWSAFFQPYPGLALTESKDVQPFLPKNKQFEATLHHDIYLDLPDRNRLINLKKIYYLCVAFPWSSRFLIWMTKFNIPFIFDLLFMMHFSYYAFTFERISFMQFLVHIKVFGINPFMRKIKNIFVKDYN